MFNPMQLMAHAAAQMAAANQNLYGTDQRGMSMMVQNPMPFGAFVPATNPTFPNPFMMNGVRMQQEQYMPQPAPAGVSNSGEMQGPQQTGFRATAGAGEATGEVVSKMPEGPVGIPNLFADFSKRLSCSYKCTGMVFHFGARVVWPKRFKAGILSDCDIHVWTPMRFMPLSDSFIDYLLWLFTNARPNTKQADLQCKYKGEVREVLKRE